MIKLTRTEPEFKELASAIAKERDERTAVYKEESTEAQDIQLDGLVPDQFKRYSLNVNGVQIVASLMRGVEAKAETKYRLVVAKAVRAIEALNVVKGQRAWRLMYA